MNPENEADGPRPITPEEAEKILCSPWLDRAVAWGLALIGFVFLAKAAGKKGDPLLALILAQGLIHNGLLLFRRPPKRITLDPRLWILAVAGAHWHLLYALTANTPGRRVLPEEATLALSAAGALLFIWARIGIGLNFGMVPAERDIVDRGPYRFARHPIYLSSFLLGLGYHLSKFSLPVLAIWSAGVGVMTAKALAEEWFLRDCPDYARYRERVRWRFLPGIW